MNLQELNPQNLKPRNKHVILHRSLVNERNGLIMPQNSAEAWKWTVVAMAEDVEHLNLGDSVWVTGKVGEDYAQIPGSTSLYIVNELCVLIVVGKECQNAYEKFQEEL